MSKTKAINLIKLTQELCYQNFTQKLEKDQFSWDRQSLNLKFKINIWTHKLIKERLENDKDIKAFRQKSEPFEFKEFDYKIK